MLRIVRNELFHWGEISPFKSHVNEFLFVENKMWFAYGRQALRKGLEALRIGGDDKVLVPDYICNVIESSFHSKKITISYYMIKEDLSPDFDDIEKKIDKRIKALLCVNYFGYPAPFDEIKAFCREHNLIFIEDNAHGFLGKHNQRWLGEFGDISITSVRKTLPVLHGAYLQNNCGFNVGRGDAGSFYIDTGFLRYFYNYAYRYVHRNILADKCHYSCKWSNTINSLLDPLMNVRLHCLALFPLRFLVYDTLYRNRILKYHRIERFLRTDLKSTGKLLLGHLAPGVLPLHIPFFVQLSAKAKKELILDLNANGIEAFRWPDLPEKIMNNPKKYPFAHHFKENLIHFPV